MSQWLLSYWSGPCRLIRYYASTLLLPKQTPGRWCQEQDSMCLSQMIFETGQFPVWLLLGNRHLCFLISITLPAALSPRASWLKNSKGKTQIMERPELKKSANSQCILTMGNLAAQENGWSLLWRTAVMLDKYAISVSSSFCTSIWEKIVLPACQIIKGTLLRDEKEKKRLLFRQSLWGFEDQLSVDQTGFQWLKNKKSKYRYSCLLIPFKGTFLKPSSSSESRNGEIFKRDTREG